MKTVKIAAFAALCLLCPLLTGAQCQPAISEYPLTGPGITTRFNQGGLWTNGYGYLPEGNLNGPIVTTIRHGALWMGGYDIDGTLKLASEVPENGINNSYYAGPLDIETGLPDGESCTNFDRFWPVTQPEIDFFLEDISDGQLDQFHLSVQSWPGRGNPLFEDNNGFELPDRDFAPFVDTNSDGVYNPLDGDYPEIRGTSALYWVYNTYLEEPPASNRPRLEVHALAQSFEIENSVMDNTTIYDFTIYNRGDTLTDFVTSLWMDTKVGCGIDDYLATLPGQSTVMVYNKDASDGLFGCNCPNSVNTYCQGPPVMGVRQLDCTMAGGRPLSSTMYFINSLDSQGLPFQVTRPLNKEQEFHFMNARWKDGSPLTRGSAGVNQPETASFVFDGNPGGTESWSMCAVGVPDIDYSVLLNSAPTNLNTGEHTKVSYAVFMVDGVELPCPDASMISQASDQICNFLNNVTSTEEIALKRQARAIPNPASHEVQIVISGPKQKEKISTLQVFDAHGRPIIQREMNLSTDNTLNIASWPRGLYFFQALTDKGSRQSGKFLKW